MRKSTEKGSVLIGVLILVIVVVMVMGAVASFITHGIHRTQATSARLQALYLAEAGVEKAIEQLKEDWDNTAGSVGASDEWIDFPSSGDKIGKYKFTIDPQDEGSDRRIIEGHGKVKIAGNKEVEEKVEVEVVKIPEEPSGGGGGELPGFDYALFTDGKINMGEGSSKILGNVATKRGPVEFPSDSQIDGSLYFGPSVEDPRANITHPSWKPLQRQEGNNTEPCITGKIGSLAEDREYLLPEFPEYPTRLDKRPDPNPDWDDAIVISENGYYPTFSIGSNRTVTIDTGGEDEERIIVVDNLNITQGHIILQGSGKLKLYVTDVFTMGGSSKINYGTNGEGDPARVTLYYGGKNTFTLGNDVGLNGTVVVKDAEVQINNAGKLKGGLISGGTKVTVQGDGSAVVKVIYAPNAAVKLDNSGKVKGAVVCQTFEASGNARLIYDESAQDIPLPGDVFPPPEENESEGGGISITSWSSGLS